MTVTFYTLSKRKNSTKQPAITGTDYTGTLTTASGIVNPSIIMDWGNTAPNCNYAYISEFGRYYWINEITSIGGGLWRVDMSCDVLASFKSSIGNNTKYVLRSASNSDGYIVDMKYPTKSGYTVNDIPVSTGWSLLLSAGTYVVGIFTPGSSNTIGSVAMYALDNADFQALRAAIAPNLYYNNIVDQDLKNLAISIVDPMQYIAFVKFYPFTLPGTMLGVDETVYLGNIPVTSCAPLVSTVYEPSAIDFTLTAHPLAASRGAYMNAEPFTQRFFSWYPTGMFHLPSTLAHLSKLRVNYDIDLMSGIGELTITNGDQNANDTAIRYRTSFSAGMDIPIAQIVSNNPLKMISGAVSLVGSVTSAISGSVVGAVSAGASAIVDFMQASVPEVQSAKPGAGSVLADTNMTVLECFANVVDDDNLEFGRPLCKAVSISTLSGFVQCADPEVYAVGATAPELEEIGAYMTGGFFYE